MKVLILAGGYGTRLSEETDIRPKPMVEIGGMPIIWHIMQTYSFYGFSEFVLLLGYKSNLIKDYFLNSYLHQSDFSIDLSTNTTQIHKSNSLPWKITLLDTGLDSMTGERILRAKEHIDNEPFMLTYGDGVANVDISKLLNFHQCNKKLCTMTAVQPVGRYGSLSLDGDSVVTEFIEKPSGDGAWINGGFFVCQPEVLNYINPKNNEMFENNPLSSLAAKSQLSAYKHHGFWQCMDTLRDKNALSEFWKSGDAPWKVWD